MHATDELNSLVLLHTGKILFCSDLLMNKLRELLSIQRAYVMFYTLAFAMACSPVTSLIDG